VSLQNSTKLAIKTAFEKAGVEEGIGSLFPREDDLVDLHFQIVREFFRRVVRLRAVFFAILVSWRPAGFRCISGAAGALIAGTFQRRRPGATIVWCNMVNSDERSRIRREGEGLGLVRSRPVPVAGTIG
jgi:hypothetical protein